MSAPSERVSIVPPLVPSASARPSPRPAPVVGGTERLYFFEHGSILVGRTAAVGAPARASARLLFLASRTEVARRFEGIDPAAFSAVAVKPLAAYQPVADSLCRLSFFIHPGHPRFIRFAAIAGSGVLPIPRHVFAALHERFDDLRRLPLGARVASGFFETVIEHAASCLPEGVPRDARIALALQLLSEKPSRSLHELSATVGLSYYRLSHLFTERVGLPLRNYLRWQKVNTAMHLLAGAKETHRLAHIAQQAGFTDHAHLSRSFREMLGISPSRLLIPGAVVVGLDSAQRRHR